MYEMKAILSETFLLVQSCMRVILASYSPKHVSQSLFNTSFCAFYKYNPKTTGCLQLYYTPNDSSTTEDALFDVKSCKAVKTYKLRSRANIAVLLFCAQVRITTNLGAPTTVM